MEFEAVQNEPRPFESVARRRTQRRDDEEDLGHDEPGSSQPPVRKYRQHQGAEVEARPSQQHK